ncbi:ureidoglycolate lyase [Desertifilum sp. FACHB-1129]|uniref:Ureidoglycolate hydrolase n=1 Tax=Desertifilum tharense IPPAS B-1220 TaxID=1781255 RepID=A0A1E5QMX4_9CYAN|nr:MULTISPECIES: ureidoglycolate lyase [Desertifilum]MDA0208574.1 ureidoglycolate lyase [Cyanobacteria bacterium FC1]MBD2312396.1 ureidoglycolate lyase [Desertifilum sp. FACHB-1129]MBD2321179.1 ureidoglycolate lyase [Desertifilum sp. FACHB-866]MBD2331514.1 ureidoglycolate lyase [Desertifilum sp. FACHB-868]OEJ76029.1 Ureidoglycolate hydrolase [Desertifilum tharense IPPAS B-1220]
MSQSPFVHQLSAQEASKQNFQAYGQLIQPVDDGKLYDTEDAQLILDRGIPRFYIMRLTANGRQFKRITRHLQCTQCLGALGGKSWWIAVAPPAESPHPRLEDIQAFKIPGDCFIKLHLGTWHAGPYFETEYIDFYNLELSDTNITDRDTCNLQSIYGVACEIV